MNNLRSCHDNFPSENGPEKGQFGLKTAKPIQKRRFECNIVGNCKGKITQCKMLLPTQVCQGFSGNEQLRSVQ